jgi:hypothetical protein
MVRGSSGFSLEMTPFSLGTLVIIEVICIGEKLIALANRFLQLINGLLRKKNLSYIIYKKTRLSAARNYILAVYVFHRWKSTQEIARIPNEKGVISSEKPLHPRARCTELPRPGARRFASVSEANPSCKSNKITAT